MEPAKLVPHLDPPDAAILPALEHAWRQAERALREERDRAQRYLDVAGTMIVVLDPEGRVELINRKGCAVLGYEEHELVGADWFAAVIPEADQPALRGAFNDLLYGAGADGESESVVLTKSGERRVIAWHSTLLYDDNGHITAALSSGDDITARRHAEQQIAYLAYHDDLTGLPNRTLLREHLDLALARASRHGTKVAVLYFDLDNFKLVNDSLGHVAGDQLLTRVAARMQRVTRATDLLARQGGDEFLLLLTDLADDAPGIAQLVAGKILDALADPFTIAGAEFQVGACIGISVFPDDAEDAEGLLMHADAAMYQAKAQGSGGVRSFKAGSGPDPFERLSLTTRLRRALDREEFELHYQPIFRLADGRLESLEALIRWQDPERGMIPPGDFIPIAEDTGLIEPIGDWVVDAICRQAQAWSKLGHEPGISFNVSPRQLRRTDLAGYIAGRIDAHGLDPARFTVEITESATIADPERIEPILRALAEAGVRLAIDDFGAGYSSLGRLRSMPVQTLKIDRSFLTGIPASRDGVEIVTAIIQLADALNMSTVAEGVETEEQRRFLIDQGCPHAQGFLLARPMPVAQTTALLALE